MTSKYGAIATLLSMSPLPAEFLIVVCIYVCVWYCWYDARYGTSHNSWAWGRDVGCRMVVRGRTVVVVEWE